MAGREIRVPAYIIAVLGEERVAQEIRALRAALERAGWPATDETIIECLDDIATHKTELEEYGRELAARAAEGDFEAEELLRDLYDEVPDLDI